MTEAVFKSVDDEGERAENHFGQLLRYEREKRGLLPEGIAGELCLSVAVIRSLEAGDTDALPELVYVRGYIRAYCRLLGIASDNLLKSAALESEESEESEENDFLPAMDEHVHHLTRLWGSIAVLSVAVLLVLLWWMDRPRELGHLLWTPAVNPAMNLAHEPSDEPPEAVTGYTSEPSTLEFPSGDRPSTPIFDPLAADTGQVEEASPVKLVEIKIYSSIRSWMYLSDGAGKILINRMAFPDYGGTFYGVFPLEFKIGDARGVRVWVGDIEYDLKRHMSQLNTAFFTLEDPLQ